MKQTFDVVIVGGGINGCGCAADAALRGLSVLLCEQDDLASKTSSSSTKLIHGGLRYLEHFDFRMVKKSLDERQKLLLLAPHLIHPLRLVLPHTKQMRSKLLLRSGLFLYDHLSQKNKLPKSQWIDRNKDRQYFAPLTDQFHDGFLFYDCSTDDARLTLENALQAKRHGAEILTRTKLIQAQAIEHEWRLTLETQSGQQIKINANALINAAGPWIEEVNRLLSLPMKHPMTLVKGSHIVVPKLYEGNHAYVLQHQDQRIIFIIPYHNQTMIGTTEVELTGRAQAVTIDDDEVDYLLNLVNQYFSSKCTRDDILTTWSGIRPLLSKVGKQSKTLSRDYAFDYTNEPAPLITIFGGKMTTYRQLAAEVIDQLKLNFKELPCSMTETTPLPGATHEHMSFNQYQSSAQKKYAWLGHKTLDRYLDQYGALTEVLLKNCSNLDDLGICFSETFYQAEVDYLRQYEWAVTVEDILWRRTKLGLTISSEAQKKLSRYCSTL